MIPVHSGDQPGRNDQPANDVGGEAPPSKLHSSDTIVIEPSAGNAKRSITMEDKIPKPKQGRRIELIVDSSTTYSLRIE